MLIRARALNLCIPMEDLKYVLSLRRQEKDLSHSQDVTGNVQAIFIRMKRLGKSFSSVALIVSARDDGLSFSSTFVSKYHIQVQQGQGWEGHPCTH